MSETKKSNTMGESQKLFYGDNLEEKGPRKIFIE